MAEIKGISIRQFSRDLGCSDTAVRKAIKAEHIRHGLIDVDTPRPKIIPDIAKKEWRESLDPAKLQSPELWVSLWDGAPPDNTPVPVDVVPREKETPESIARTEAARQYQTKVKDATADKTVFAAKIAELNYKKAAGELVERGDVYKAFFAIGKELRSSIMSVPDRIIDDLFACDDRNVAHSVLYNELAAVLTRVSEIKEVQIDG